MKKTFKFALTSTLFLSLVLGGLSIGADTAIAQTYYPYNYGNNNFCYNFNTDLQIGSSGAAVEALHTALSREGFNKVNTWNTSNNIFTEETASLVSGFQEKYRYDILTPVGYKNGTGFVGSYTRAKLNALFNTYNCGNGGGGGNNNSNVSITVSPNKSNFSYGEDIIFTITARNNTAYEKTLSFNTGCQTSYKIGVYDSGTNQICTQAFTSVRVPAYGVYTWTITHRQYTYNLSAGTYTLIGRVLGYGDATATVTIGTGSGNGNTGTNYPRVISPNGGEYLRKGTYQNLSWQLPNVNYFQAQAMDVTLIPQNSGYNPYPYQTGYQTQYQTQYQNSYSTCPVGSTCAYNGGSVYNPPVYTPYDPYYNQYPQYASSYMILQNTYLTSFNWLVGSTPSSWSGVPTGTYKLQVCLSGTSNCDLSDNYFTINN